ncbi:unnamed protein product, partial [Didymodactylos carnosus]
MILPQSISSTFENDYWLKKYNLYVVCHQDAYLYYYHLYSLPFLFDNVDFLSNSVVNCYSNNNDKNLLDDPRSWQTVEYITPNAFNVEKSLTYDLLRGFKDKYKYLKRISIMWKFSLDKNLLIHQLTLPTVNVLEIYRIQYDDTENFYMLFRVLPNIKILITDSYSVYKILECSIIFPQLFRPFNQITELHINEMNDNYSHIFKHVQFTKYFRQVKVLKLSFRFSTINIVYEIFKCALTLMKNLTYCQFYLWG